MWRNPACLAASLLLVASVSACGGGDSANHPAPKLIPGGGVADGPLDDQLHVYVVDNATKAPVAGAYVQIGDDQTLSGLTDTTGLITFTDSKIKAPAVVTASAAGYTTTSFVDVVTANVTLPIGSKQDPPFATFTGTIQNFDTAAPMAPAGHFTAAIVRYSTTTDLKDPQNNIVTPKVGLSDPTFCLRGFPCNWTLRTRVGKIALWFAIADVTNDLKTVTPLKFGIMRGLTATAGAMTSNVSLAVSHDTLTMVNVTLPAAPAQLDQSQALPALKLDNGEGQIVLPEFATMASPSFAVPALTGPLAGQHYDVYAFANAMADAGNAANDQRASVSVARGYTDLTRSPDLMPYLGLPTSLTVNAGSTFSWTLPAGGNPARSLVSLSATDGSAWLLFLIDPARKMVTLPILPAGKGQLPSGMMIKFGYDVLEVPNFNRGGFDLPTAGDTVTRGASDFTTFTN